MRKQAIIRDIQAASISLRTPTQLDLTLKNLNKHWATCTYTCRPCIKASYNIASVPYIACILANFQQKEILHVFCVFPKSKSQIMLHTSMLFCYCIPEQCQVYIEGHKTVNGLLTCCCASTICEEAWFQKCNSGLNILLQVWSGVAGEHYCFLCFLLLSFCSGLFVKRRRF